MVPDGAVAELTLSVPLVPLGGSALGAPFPATTVVEPEDPLPPLLSNKDEQLPLLPDAEVYP